MKIGEATLMGILGGILGIVCGGAIVYCLNSYPALRRTEIFSITPRLLVIAILFSTLLGILSGIYPAYRAAKMKPIEALRFE
jgi:putative ABC transport system permease protein